MVTGRRAFTGKSATDTMAAILKDEPPTHDLAFALRSLSSSSGEQKSVSAPARIGRGLIAAAVAAVLLILASGGFYY